MVNVKIIGIWISKINNCLLDYDTSEREVIASNRRSLPHKRERVRFFWYPSLIISSSSSLESPEYKDVFVLTNASWRLS